MEDEYGMRECWISIYCEKGEEPLRCMSCGTFSIKERYFPKEITFNHREMRYSVNCSYKDCEELKTLSPMCPRCFVKIFDIHEKKPCEAYPAVNTVKFTKKLPPRTSKNPNKIETE